MFDKPVMITVGSKAIRFHFHQGILSHYSSYFRKAIGGRTDSAEAHGGSIHFENAEIEVFESFRSWLYTGTVHAEKEMSREILCHAWVLGEALGVRS